MKQLKEKVKELENQLKEYQRQEKEASENSKRVWHELRAAVAELREEEDRAKMATATHIAKCGGALVHVRETEKMWINVLTGMRFRKTDDPTKSDHVRQGERWHVTYYQLTNIRKIDEANP